jgi:hypothetical protein
MLKRKCDDEWRNPGSLQACLDSATYTEHVKGLLVRVNTGTNGTADYQILRIEGVKAVNGIKDAQVPSSCDIHL